PPSPPAAAFSPHAFAPAVDPPAPTPGTLSGAGHGRPARRYAGWAAPGSVPVAGRVVAAQPAGAVHARLARAPTAATAHPRADPGSAAVSRCPAPLRWCRQPHFLLPAPAFAAGCIDSNPRRGRGAAGADHRWLRAGGCLACLSSAPLRHVRLD